MQSQLLNQTLSPDLLSGNSYPSKQQSAPILNLNLTHDKSLLNCMLKAYTDFRLHIQRLQITIKNSHTPLSELRVTQTEHFISIHSDYRLANTETIDCKNFEFISIANQQLLLQSCMEL